MSGDNGVCGLSSGALAVDEVVPKLGATPTPVSLAELWGRPSYVPVHSRYSDGGIDLLELGRDGVYRCVGSFHKGTPVEKVQGVCGYLNGTYPIPSGG
jgi:hypothetical protein